MSIKIQVISDLHLEFLKALPKIFRPLKLSSQSTDCDDNFKAINSNQTHIKSEDFILGCDDKLIPKFSQKPQFVTAPYLFLAGDIG